MSDNLKDTATVLIPGYGKLTISQLEKEVIANFKDIVKKAERGDFKAIMWILTQPNSTLQAQLKALCDIEDGKYQITLKK